MKMAQWGSGMGKAMVDQVSGAKSRGNALRKVAVAVFLSTTAGYAAFPMPVAAQSYTFGSVRVEGNERVDGATILSYAEIATGQTLSAAELNDAYQRILGSGLFETVEILPQGGTLVVRVQEYPTINVISFEGNARIKDDDLAKIIRSQSRRVYSPSQAEADAAAITSAYGQSGRLAAAVTPKIIRRSDNRVDLVFEIREGAVSEIERIAFVGNRAYSDNRLRRVMATKQAGLLRRIIQSDTYVEDRIEFDKQLLRDFYMSRGYADFQILSAQTEFSRERDAFFVTFTLREGQQFKFGEITTTSDIPEADADEFQKALKLRSGVLFSPTVIDNNITRLELLAQQKGLNFVRVEPRLVRNERDQTIDIEFAITRGPRVFVERIDIEGNTTTLDRVVRRQFRTVEGDPFNPREIRQSAERIRALGYFSDAQVNTRPGSSPDQVIVDVDVEEQPTGSLSFGVSYGVNSGPGFAVSFSEANFLGRGQYVSLSFSSGLDNSDTSFTFIEPYFLDRNVRFRFSAYYRQSEQDNSYYDTRNIGIVPSIEFPVSQNGRLDLKYRISQDTVKNVNEDASDILHKEAEFGGLYTSAVGYTYSFDNRLTGLNPNAGILFRFSQDYAGLGGDTEFIATSALLVAETKIMQEEVTLRAAFEGGGVHMLEGNSRVAERQFLNGKIRGFESNGIGPRDLEAPNQDALGGNLFAAARFEADFPLGLPEEYGITGGLFWDIGSVWGLDNRDGGPLGAPIPDSVDDSLKWRSAVGFSVYWTTPIGPLRFNFSRAIKKEDYDKVQNFDLTVSTRF